MSPALLGKYLQAAREVANHLVFKPDRPGLRPAPHAGRDRPGQVLRHSRSSISTGGRPPTSPTTSRPPGASSTGPRSASRRRRWPRWRPRTRSAPSTWHWSGAPSSRPREQVGPIAKLQTMWRGLPPPAAGDPASGIAQARRAASGCATSWSSLRKKIEPRFAGLSVEGMRGTAQPFLMWKNRQYAGARMSYDRERPADRRQGQAVPPPAGESAKGDADDEDDDAAPARPAGQASDPDLLVPAADRARYEAALRPLRGRVPRRLLRGRARPQLPGQDAGQGSAAQRRVPQPDGLLPRRPARSTSCSSTTRGRRSWTLCGASWTTWRPPPSAPTSSSTSARAARRASGAPAAEGGRFAASEDKDVTTEAMIKQVKEVYLGQGARRAANAPAHPGGRRALRHRQRQRALGGEGAGRRRSRSTWRR